MLMGICYILLLVISAGIIMSGIVHLIIKHTGHFLQAHFYGQNCRCIVFLPSSKLIDKNEKPEPGRITTAVTG